MPSYSLFCQAETLSDEQADRVAKAISETHSVVTGAPAYLAQVIMHDIARGRYFLGGRRSTDPHVFLHGHIRGGRSVEDKIDLVEKLCAQISEIAGISSRQIFVYISELPPRQMLEFGHVLPEPGDEAAWFSSLPEEDRAHMTRL